MPGVKTRRDGERRAKEEISEGKGGQTRGGMEGRNGKMNEREKR